MNYSPTAISKREAHPDSTAIEMRDMETPLPARPWRGEGENRRVVPQSGISGITTV
jgi:hypothetical protein